MSLRQESKIRNYHQAGAVRSAPLSPNQRDELITTYTPLIRHIASRLAVRLPDHVDLDDLMSSGVIGLIDAIDKFDTDKNVKFKTYAEFRIKGAMLDELRSLDWVPRSVRQKINRLEQACVTLESRLGRPASDEETAEFLELSLAEFHKLLDDTKAVTFVDIDLLRQKCSHRLLPESETMVNDHDPFAAFSLAQVRSILATAIDQLPNKEQLTLSLYYYNELTMKEIGGVLGYTESRISQIHSRAMIRLRGRLKKSLAGRND